MLAALAEGPTNREIAASLYMAEKTASVHVSRILARLGVRSRTEAAAVAHRLALVDPGGGGGGGGGGKRGVRRLRIPGRGGATDRRAGAGEVDLVEGLWKEMVAHHQRSSGTGRRGGTPTSVADAAGAVRQVGRSRARG